MTMAEAVQSRRTEITIGAWAALLGGVLALVVNALHGDLPADSEAVLTRVAGSPTWGLLHLGIMISVVLILIGLFGLSQVAVGPLARTLARLSVVIALPGAAVMLVGLAIDGFATKALADLWAAAAPTEQATIFHTAVAVEQVQNALFHTWAALFIGLPFLLMGISGLAAGGGFPRWHAAIAVVGGAGALFMGITGFLHLPLPGLLFNLSALIVTLWILIAGVLVLRQADRQ